MSQEFVHFSEIAQNNSSINASSQRKPLLSGGNLQQSASASSMPTSTVNFTPTIDNGIFSLSKVQFDFKGSLVRMAVCNNILLMAMSHLRLLRIDLLRPQIVEDIEISKRPEDVIENLFMDPNGRHVLITMTNGDVYYHYYTWKRSKLLSKLKNIGGISTVGWTSGALDITKGGSSGPLIIGTKTGVLFEVELEPSEEYFRREERYVKELFRMENFGEHQSISGIYIDRIPEIGQTMTSLTKVFILVTVDNRIYQFKETINADLRVSEPVFDKIFALFQQSPVYQELPGHLETTQLAVYYAQGIAKSSYAWMTAPGIFCGEFKLTSSDTGNDSVIEGSQILPYPAQIVEDMKSNQDITVDAPRYLGITQFHHILLYKERIRILSKLNDEIVYESMLPAELHEKSCHLAIDEMKGTYWIYGDQDIYEIVITGEDKNVWSIYLHKKQYDTAIEYAKNDTQKDIIRKSQADNFFSQERYLLAASLYGQSKAISFEECVLKFMDTQTAKTANRSLPKTQALMEALEKYLLERFKRLPESALSQRTMIVTMILDVLLSQYKHSSATVSFDRILNWLQSPGVKKAMDKRVSYQLFINHGATELLVEFAALVHDFDRVMNYFITRKDWIGALKSLSRNQSYELIYKFFPLLMQNAPVETVDLLLRYDQLDLKELIRGILGTNTGKSQSKLVRQQAIRLLEYHINKLDNADSAVHNFLLSLYVLQNDEQNSHTLMTFIRNPARHFDLQYALRLCNQWNRYDACIVLYGELGLYEEAVDLALKLQDETLAEIYANKSYDNESLRKKLWLKISQHKIKSAKDIKAVVKDLKNIDAITIEDVLAYLPDFVLVDDIKDEIAETLQDYKNQIDNIKSDMYDATRSAEAMRKDIQLLKGRFKRIPTSYKCPLCLLPLMTSNFYAFSCGHNFHVNCIIDHMALNYLTIPMQQRVITIETELKLLKNSQYKEQQQEESHLTSVQKLQEELDDLVASDCVICGAIVIRGIDKPFVSKSDVDMKSKWSV